MVINANARLRFYTALPVNDNESVPLGTVLEGALDDLQELAEDFDGSYVACEGDGWWKDDSGKVVHEPVIALELTFPDHADVFKIEAVLKNVLFDYKRGAKQQAVVLQRGTDGSCLIWGNADELLAAHGGCTSLRGGLREKTAYSFKTPEFF